MYNLPKESMSIQYKKWCDGYKLFCQSKMKLSSCLAVESTMLVHWQYSKYDYSGNNNIIKV